MRVAPTQFGSLPAKAYRTIRYDQFLGVDFSTDPAMVDGRRSPDAVNLISDAGGFPEKRVGWEILQTKTGEQVNGLYHFVDGAGTAYFAAHCGTKLYVWTDILTGAGAATFPGLNNARSTTAVYGGKLYILDGVKYWVFNGSTLTDIAANPSTAAYTPTTVIGRAPTGGGVPLEAVNLLSPWRKNSFVGNGGVKEVVRLQIYNAATANGNVTITLNGVATNVAILTSDSTVGIATKITATSFSGWTVTQVGDAVTFTKGSVGTNSPANFSAGSTGTLAGIVTLTPGAAAATTLQLDATGLDVATVLMVVAGVSKTETTDFTVNRTTGVITYSVGTPEGNGVDNIVVTFAKTVSGYPDRVKGCTIAAWFGMGNDSRLFISGNPAYPNMDWQSGLFDPTYFPDTGYTKIGADSSAIMGYLRQYDSMLIIKQDNEQDATIFQRSADLDADGNPYFALKQSTAGIGAVSKYSFATLRDDPLFLAKEGVFSPVTDYYGIKGQRTAQGRSALVNAQLTQEENLSSAVGVIWNDLYLLCVNGHAYVADARKKSGKRSTESYGYEWFYWDNIPDAAHVVRAAVAIGDELYFGDEAGRICRFKSEDESTYRFSDGSTYPAQYVDDVRVETGQPINAGWSSKLDDDGDYMLYKTMPRKGSGILVKPYSRSSVDVYVRTDEQWDYKVRGAKMNVFDWNDIDFTSLSFNTNDSPYVVPLNSLVRRYKTIQIILRNNALNEGFGCFGILRRFTVGNYVR